MIQKLKNKFILINMVFVIAVMLVLLSTFFISEYNNEKQQMEYNLELSLENNGDFRLSIEENPKKQEELKMQGKQPKEDGSSLVQLTKVMPTFTVEVDKNGTIVHIEDSHVDIDESTVKKAVKEALQTGKSSGTMEEMSLKYKIKTEDGTSIVAFLDTSLSDIYLRGIAIKLVLVFVAGCIIFLGISVYLAKITVKPVEEAWKRQKQFIADASHELKTPLTVILTNLDIIAAHKEDTILQQKKWLKNTKEEANRMKQLLEDLLFLAKSDAAVMPIAKQQIDFSYLVLGTTLLFESIAYENKIQLEEKVDDDIVINGDEKQLKQLVAILVDNACKYGQNGRVDVTLQKKQDKILLEVKNSIKNEEDVLSKEEIEHIFERFYRVDQSRARKQGGYGLGLSIASAIVKHHGGKIKVRSSIEEGTVFCVSFATIKNSTNANLQSR